MERTSYENNCKSIKKAKLINEIAVCSQNENKRIPSTENIS